MKTNYQDLYAAMLDENLKLLRASVEIEDALKEAMVFIFKTKDIDECPYNRVLSLKNYIENLYAFIFENGLYEKFTDFHDKTNMIEPGGHDRVLSVLMSTLPCKDLIEDLSQN